MLVDTEGFVLKAKVHSAKVMDYEGITLALLGRAKGLFPRLAQLWMNGGYTGEDKGADWVQKTFGWSVQIVSRPRKAAPEEVLMAWAKEGVKVDRHKHPYNGEAFGPCSVVFGQFQKGNSRKLRQPF